MRFNAILVIIILVVACNEDNFRKLCWQEYTKVKLCYPVFENCLNAGQGIAGCRNIFQICIMTEPTHSNTKFCHNIIANITEYKIISETEWHQNNLDNILNHFDKNKSQKENNCDVHNLLFKNIKPKTTNALIKKMSSLASLYCPCSEKQDGEAIRASKMNIPLQMWYGGFSTKKCWRELDRFLVEYHCGVSSALEINHIWAKRADCHEDLHTLEGPNKSKCHKIFFSALKEHANISSTQSTCKLYSEMIEAYLPFSQTMSLGYKITNINTSDIRYLQPFEYRDDRLYLINSFGDSTHFTCFPVKREISSCIYIHEHCKTDKNIEKCGVHLVDCLSNISPNHTDCKTLLVQRNDNIGTLEKIYHFAVNNKLQLAWPIILYVLWILTKSVIDWLLLSTAIKICLKLSDFFYCLKNRIYAKTEEIRRLSQNLNVGESGLYPIPSYILTTTITIPEFPYEEIPLEALNENNIGNNNNNNDNNGNREETVLDENEKLEKKVEQRLNFGQSLKKMLRSFGGFIVSLRTFIWVSIKNEF